MHIIDKMIMTKISRLLEEIDRLSVEAIDAINEKMTSTRISDLTSPNKVPEHITLRIATIELQISIMRRLMSDAD